MIRFLDAIQNVDYVTDDDDNTHLYDDKIVWHVTSILFIISYKYLSAVFGTNPLYINGKVWCKDSYMNLGKKGNFKYRVFLVICTTMNILHES